jgi:hypothetical protein
MMNRKRGDKRTIAAFAARVARLPVVGNHPALRIDPWIEGYREYTFGGKAGPEIAIINVFHELAHAAEFGARRFCHRTVGGKFYFKIPRVFLFGSYYAEPRTVQGSLREAKTFAYQLHLMQAAGLRVKSDEFFDEMARVMVYLADAVNVPGDGSADGVAWRRERIVEFYNSVDREYVLDQLKKWLDAHARQVK